MNGTDFGGATQCHMTDLNSRKSAVFEKWTSEQAGKRLKDSIALINRFASYGVAISCDLKEMGRLLPTAAAPGSEIYLDGFSSAYATCCHLAMYNLANLLREHESRSRISYFFEAGDKDQAKAARFWELAARSALAERYRLLAHTRIKKEDCRLLEMSDILAWEWARHIERVQKGQRTRPSLKVMLDPDGDGLSSERDYASHSRRALHITGASLERYFTRVQYEILS
jgi:hypothetical protein